MIRILRRHLATEAAVVIAVSALIILDAWEKLPSLEACHGSNNCIVLFLESLFTWNVGPRVLLFLFLLGISILRLMESVEITRIEPIGYFRSRVSALSNTFGAQPKPEYSLVQIRRLRNGALEYRGINKTFVPNDPYEDKLDFRWTARDVLINRTNQAYRFFYKTDYEDIIGRDGRQNGLENLGFVDYQFQKKRISALGVFFDFEPTGGSVKRKRLELADASNILTAGERRAIDEFFIDPLSGPNEHAMLQILKKVEVAYTTGLITRGIKMEPTIQKQLVIAACCVAANVGLGKLSNLVSLPFSMDTIGTILGAAMLPWPVLIVTAILSSILEAIAIQPPFIYFVGTQIAIAIAARLLLFAGLFDSLARSVFAGLIIGIISAIVSAPVIAFVFGGIAVPSVSAVNALFLASGHSLWASVVSGSLIVESIDKMAAGAIVWLVLIRLAPDLRQ